MESREPEVECLICVLKALSMLSTCVGSFGEFRSIILQCSLSLKTMMRVLKQFVNSITLIKQVTGKHNDGCLDG